MFTVKTTQGFSPLPGFMGSEGLAVANSQSPIEVSVPFRGLWGLKAYTMRRSIMVRYVSVPFRGLWGLKEQPRPEPPVPPSPCSRATRHA